MGKGGGVLGLREQGEKARVWERKGDVSVTLHMAGAGSGECRAGLVRVKRWLPGVDVENSEF